MAIETERFNEAAQIDTEPFDCGLLGEIYVRPYAQEVYMPDAFAALVFRYFELFDQKYGTDVSSYVDFIQVIGHSSEKDEDYLAWYQEAPGLLSGAMENTGWHMGIVSTEELQEYRDDTAELPDNKDLPLRAYRKLLDDQFRDSFLKDVLLKESGTVMGMADEMEEGSLAIIWNPELDGYMHYREEHPGIIETACKDEDQWIMKLEEDIWEPYIAFYRQEKDTFGGMAYCRVVLGYCMDAYISFEAINPNWICKAVKLSKMLQLANEKLSRFRQEEKQKAA